MIVLVNMPFGSITLPPLALGLIKSQLEDAGMPCRVLHMNFVFAQAVGFGAYETIARFKGHETQVSEWLFSEVCWRRDFGPDEDEFLELCGGEIGNIPKVKDPIEFLRKVRHDVVPAFIELAYQRVVENGVPTVVGFTCMFFQTVAALALGRVLKERHPQIKLVYGGACFHEEMGEELIRAAHWIDAISTGEADMVIVPLFQALLRGETPRDLESIVAREPGGALVSGPPPRSITGAELDQLPDPNFDEFFAEAGTVGLVDNPDWFERSMIPYEASRGCWWGQKKHCTFCGLNAAGLGFREKSAERVLTTIRNLSARYRVRSLNATDNILSMKYFKTLLPDLIAEPVMSAGKPVRLFFEVKANLTRAHIQQLHAAGITQVQPGIESLSTGILDRFDKGVNALQNVFFLKCCGEHDVVPMWNLLIRLPGETREDYVHMEQWLPLLFHLRPPGGGAPRVECHRFSPYFFRTGQYVEDMRPARWYRGLFPEDQVDLAKVAYYFDVTWKDTLGDPAYDQILALVDEWRDRWLQPEAPRLTFREVNGVLEIEDTRRGELVTWTLSELQSELYRHVGDPASPRQIAERVNVDEELVRTELCNLVEKGLAVREGDRFLGLALAPFAPEIAPEIRRVEMVRVANQEPTHARIRLPVV